jgi:hypothetical protein
MPNLNLRSIFDPFCAGLTLKCQKVLKMAINVFFNKFSWGIKNNVLY